MHPPRKILPLLLLCLAALSVAAQTTPAGQHWIATWAASQQIPEPQNSLPAAGLHDLTLRQIVHVSVGGTTVRVHLTNAFGTEPLHFTSVHLAHPIANASPSAATPGIDPASDRALTFGGATDVTLPPGADYVSDPIAFSLAPLSSLTVTFHLDALPSRQTGHPGSRATSFYAPGDLVTSPDLPTATPVDHWYQLAGVEVLASPDASAIVALGDSITDGHGATTNGNDRWTDVLAARLQSRRDTQKISVLNQGIGGNHILTDGLGPNAVSRFDRDVVAPMGVRWLIVFEGVNDLGGLTIRGEVPAAQHAALVARIIAAYEQFIVRAHAAGIEAMGATITPYTGSDYYHPGPLSEADRQAINAWIRNAAAEPGRFDRVLDFDRVVRDPAHPDRLLPAYDSGDHLHPNPAGYRALGNSISLSFFNH